MQQTNAFEKSLSVKAYFVLGMAMYFCFYRLISASMLSQTNHPLFLFAQSEIFYRLYLQSGIPQFITSNSVITAVLDVSLLVLTIGYLLSFNRIFIVLFTLVLLNYFITYNLVTGHHYHGLFGLLIITLPFWFKKEQKFNLAWDLARYYLLYIFASAALWKILRGSAFYDLQLSNIVKQQQINLLLQAPESFKAHIAQYFISHSVTAHIVLLLNVVLQGSFLIGFFTKKYDRILLCVAILFVVANYYVMGIVSFEMLVLGLTLLDWPAVEAWLIKQGTIAA
jgi:hypothetical protein